MGTRMSTTKNYFSLYQNTNFGINYNAGHEKLTSWQFSSDPRILIGCGAYIDVLDNVGTAIRSSLDEPPDLARTAHLFLENEEMVRKSNAVAERASPTLVHWELLSSRYWELRGDNLNFCHYEPLRALAHRDPSLFPGDREELVMRISRFIPIVFNQACGQRPCLAVKGYVFSGELTPFVLRRSEREEDCYTVIGECFIYSRMQVGSLKREVMEDITLV